MPLTYPYALVAAVCVVGFFGGQWLHDLLHWIWRK